MGTARQGLPYYLPLGSQPADPPSPPAGIPQRSWVVNMDELHPRQGAGLTPADGDARARERLLRAAADVFDRKGYAAASVREIVERAGITKPVLYYHFGSKEGMLAAILDEGERFMRDAVTGAMAERGARDRIKALCEAVYVLFRENVSAVRVVHALYFGPHEGMPAFDWCRFERLLVAAFAQIAEDGMASGEIRATQPADVALAIQGVFAGCMDMALDREPSAVGIDAIHRVIDLIFDGLSARERKEN